VSVFRCERWGCKKPIKLDTEPWTTRRLPETNRHGVVCEPCAKAIDELNAGEDPADAALRRDVEAATAVDAAARARAQALARPSEASPFKPPKGQPDGNR